MEDYIMGMLKVPVSMDGAAKTLATKHLFKIEFAPNS